MELINLTLYLSLSRSPSLSPEMNKSINESKSSSSHVAVCFWRFARRLRYEGWEGKSWSEYFTTMKLSYKSALQLLLLSLNEETGKKKKKKKKKGGKKRWKKEKGEK